MSNDWRLNLIAPDKLIELQRFCTCLNIVGDDFDAVFTATALLASYEIDKRSEPTNKSRADALNVAIVLSEKLSKAIEVIYNDDRIEIGPLRGLRLHEDFKLENMLDDFRCDAKRQLEKLHERGVKGRRPVLEWYALFVSYLWEPAGRVGLVLGRNGHFHRLCDAAFQAAGVPAAAEGALRHFIKNGAPPPDDD
jgi:hypothetical protein